MVTIKDVAKKANVSIATVSAVINNNKFVSEELKRKVEEAIEELGYRPNKVAQGLKKKETRLIGVVVTEITNPFYPLMLKGVEDIAKENSYNIILCTTDDDPDKEYELIQSMVDQGIDGAVLATIDNENSKSLRFLEKEKVPHVLINRAPKGYSGNSVCIDSYRVGEMATNFLINLGHKDIAFIGGNRLNSWEREKGYKDTLAKYGISLDKSRIIRSRYVIEDVYNDVKFMLKNGNLPTAIFAASDIMAFGAIKALLDEGYRVPEDISVIGSDNISFSEDFLIPLTTVDARAYEIGRIGCEILIKLLKGENSVKPQRLFLQPQIVERKSCGSNIKI
jgi:DNA-binding LacI/PurR family transcriptional regulator